jgi:esterase/lipase superfamily enzyme
MNLIVLLLVFLFCTSAAHADDNAPAFIRVPMLFVTDRNQLLPTKLQAIDFGPHRKYSGECLHDPFMGTAFCVVANVDKKPITPALKALGWEPAAPKEKETVTQATLIQADNFTDIQKKFYDKVHEQALLSPDKSIFIFAHGYKYTFHRALFSAARMAYNAERPLILYSWPSVAKLRSYTADENNVEWSQEHFNDVVVRLEKMCADDPSVTLRMYAHSMGNRLIVRACPLLREQKCFTEFNMICPDVDDGLVQHYARKYLSANGTAKIRIYMSQKDKALAFSQLLHGGYTRLGECADSFGGMVDFVLGNKDAASDKPDPNMEALLAKTKARMQTIDFTAIDLGWMGHSIPAKLICSMSFYGKPCTGLSLVDEESGSRGKTANFFAKLTKVTDKDEAETHLGKLLRVVKIKPGSAPTVASSTPATGN